MRQSTPSFVVKKDPREDPEKFRKAIEDTEEDIFKSGSKKNILEDEEFLKTISSPVGYITTLIHPSPKDSNEQEEFEWNRPQRNYLSHQGNSAIIKCRQSGFSYAVSANKFARANILNKDFQVIIISINKAEAQNKIAYIEEFIELVPAQFRRRIKYRTKQSIEFENSDKTTAKIVSHAQKPARGFHGDAVLDECDFYNDPMSIYESIMPGVNKFGGNITPLSTPFDPEGFFRRLVDPVGFYGSIELASSKNEFNDYKRFVVCWWHINHYLKPQFRSFEGFQYVFTRAPHLGTEERVNIFGNEIIQKAFRNSISIESFQQEYEAIFMDKNAQFFKPKEVKSCVCRDYEEIAQEDFGLNWASKEEIMKAIEEDDSNVLNSAFPLEKMLIENGIIPKIYGDAEDENSIEEVISAYHNKLITGKIIISMDIGTTGHSTDLMIYEVVYLKSHNKNVLIPRFWLSKKDWQLSDQTEYVTKRIMEKIPVFRIGVDTNGIGMNVGQNLAVRFPNQFTPIPWHHDNVVKCIRAYKKLLSECLIGVFPYKEVISALGGVKRKLTDSTRKESYTLTKKGGGHSDSVASASIAALIFHDEIYMKDIVGGNGSLGIKTTSSDINDLERKRIKENASHELAALSSSGQGVVPVAMHERASNALLARPGLGRLIGRIT